MPTVEPGTLPLSFSHSLSFAGVSRQLEQSVTRTFVGTNAYMAPERILSRPYDERSEVGTRSIREMWNSRAD